MDTLKSFEPRKRTISPASQAKVNEHSRKLRAKRKLDGACVNHDDRAATYGCRCFECWLVHRLTKRDAASLLDRAVARCLYCELRVPHDYGKFLDGVGMMHERCEARFFAEYGAK